MGRERQRMILLPGKRKIAFVPICGISPSGRFFQTIVNLLGQVPSSTGEGAWHAAEPARSARATLGRWSARATLGSPNGDSVWARYRRYRYPAQPPRTVGGTRPNNIPRRPIFVRVLNSRFDMSDGLGSGVLTLGTRVPTTSRPRRSW